MIASELRMALDEDVANCAKVTDDQRLPEITRNNPRLHHENMPIYLQGYTLFFLFLLKKHRLWVLVGTASMRRF